MTGAALNLKLGFGTRLRTVALAMLVVFLAGCEGCDPLFLIPIDAGLLTKDGGSGANEDAGGDANLDAGDDFLDAGAEDGGAQGAVPCEWEQAEVPFVCEEDADFCDPLGDAETAGGDLLAGWSRIEGNELILQLRFAARPFVYPHNEAGFAIDGNAFFGVRRLQVIFGPPQQEGIDGFHLLGATESVIGSSILYLVEAVSDRDFRRADGGTPTSAAEAMRWPPDYLGVLAGPVDFTGGGYQEINFIISEHLVVSASVPLIELRIPLYSLTDFDVSEPLLWAAGISVGSLWWGGTGLPKYDHSWPAGEASTFAVSKGGQADEATDLISADRLVCPGSAPNPDDLILAACNAGAAGYCAANGSAWSCETEAVANFEDWCPGLETSTCEIFTDYGAACVLSQSYEDLLVFDEQPDWQIENTLTNRRDLERCYGHSGLKVCGLGSEVEGWGCQPFTGCRDEAPTCVDDGVFPKCDGDMLIMDCNGLGQPLFVDCTSSRIGGEACLEGKCHITQSYKCDDQLFPCREGLVCTKRPVPGDWGSCQPLDGGVP